MKSQKKTSTTKRGTGIGDIFLPVATPSLQGRETLLLPSPRHLGRSVAGHCGTHQHRNLLDPPLVARWHETRWFPKPPWFRSKCTETFFFKLFSPEIPVMAFSGNQRVGTDRGAAGGEEPRKFHYSGLQGCFHYPIPLAKIPLCVWLLGPER